MSSHNSLNSSCIFVCILSALWIVAACFGKSPFYPVIVNGESMESTLKDEDHGFVLTYSKIDRYDIVVFRATCNGTPSLLIKRVVGLPGDTVECRSHVLYVNGEPAVEFAKDADFNTDFDTVTVPENSYFVLGDNREVSLDSRYSEIGFVNRAQIVGVFYKV